MDAHIMSDGRPAWAWEAERDIINQDRKENRRKEKELASVMLAMNVLKILRHDEPIDDTVHIKFCVGDLIRAKNLNDPKEIARIAETVKK